MGEVIEAWDRLLGRTVAVKRPLPKYRSDLDVLAMLSDEARIGRRIQSPQVVPILDYGEDLESPFIVMPLIDGLSGSGLLRSLGGDLLPLDAVCRIGAQIALGAHALHELLRSEGATVDVIHRDISPPNVLIGRDGIVRVTDFGIAKSPHNSARTATGVVKGKPGYMAPEQLRYESADRRADLFALGVLVFELSISARLYPTRNNRLGAQEILHAPPPDLGLYRGDAPREFIELLFELLAKSPADRPADAAIVARRLMLIADEVVHDEEPTSIASLIAHYQSIGAVPRDDATEPRA